MPTTPTLRRLFATTSILLGLAPSACGVASAGAGLAPVRVTATRQAATPVTAAHAAAPTAASVALVSATTPTVSLNEGLPAGFTIQDVPQPGPPLAVPTAPRRLESLSQTGNEAVLTVSPAETMPAVEGLISSAQHTLWIEMFEFGGTYGAKLVPLLLQRARAGVSIKLLLDEVGSDNKVKGIKPWAAQLAAAGVEIRFYKVRPRSDEHGERRFNITHRKLLLVDGTYAMEGGTNLGTGWDTTTQDLMVRWRGPVVGDLYHAFLDEWAFVGGETLPMPAGPFAPAGDVDAQVLVTDTPGGRFEIRDAVFHQIDTAEREILIDQQYCWDSKLIQHLLDALKRGVKVRVIIPGGTKEKYTLWSLNMDAVHKLVLAGAEARMFYNQAAPEAHLHTKYFEVDDRWVATGTCNGDERSFQDHQELDVVSTTAAFVAETRERVFEHEWSSESRPYVYQAPSLFAKPLRGLIDELEYYF